MCQPTEPPRMRLPPPGRFALMPADPLSTAPGAPLAMHDPDWLLDYPVLFVTGTDTDVGKTVATAAMARWLRARGERVLAIKPIASGCGLVRGQWMSEDAKALHRACGDDGASLLRGVGGEPGFPLVAFKEPLGPVSAARAEDRTLDVDTLAATLQALVARARSTGTRLLIEGVGGALVPLNPGVSVADFIARLGVPSVVVTRTALGTINHTLMTIEALGSRDVRVAGLVASRQHGGAFKDVELASLSEIRENTPGAIELAVLDRLRTIDSTPRWLDWPG